MKIGLCSDHRGFYMKRILIEYLEHEGYEVEDYGTDSTDSVDFPEFASLLGSNVVKKRVDKGIAICGTGIGMSIALNKINGIYCAKVNSINEAVLSRQHNDANVIAMSADLDEDLAKEMVDKFIETKFLGDAKYKRRNKMIKDLENNG
ncbi:MAG: RpiB/LacA/LacB family sugar-phosphate isomerase [Bacilli bacterium]|nr:RpiB/LacA/LacB family sugar-phosphate isomerase [Bacilli bacterium]